MPLNKGYLTADKTTKGDETFTPAYAVLPLIKYLSKEYIIWCPFDNEESEYVKCFTDNGFKVIYSHIETGQDFLTYEPKESYDIIIGNPPYSIKDKILKRLTELNKPYAMLLPLPTLQGQSRFEDLKDCQALIFDKRIKFIQNGKVGAAPAFASIYICKNFLPKDLIFEELKIK